jgi:hypothetical protein
MPGLPHFTAQTALSHSFVAVVKKVGMRKEGCRAHQRQPNGCLAGKAGNPETICAILARFPVLHSKIIIVGKIWTF